MPAEERPVPERHKTLFEEIFSIFEVKKAVQSAKLCKSCCFGEIPSEVLNNDASIYFLHVLFNACFGLNFYFFCITDTRTKQYNNQEYRHYTNGIQKEVK